MPNMGYCRFSNTLGDLQECYGHMDDELSEREAEAKEDLVALCKKIVEDYGEDKYEW